MSQTNRTEPTLRASNTSGLNRASRLSCHRAWWACFRCENAVSFVVFLSSYYSSTCCSVSQLISEEASEVVEYDGRVLWRAPTWAFPAKSPGSAAKTRSAKRLLELVEVNYGTGAFGGANLYQNDGRCANALQFGVVTFPD
jgi:hypothetical protein